MEYTPRTAFRRFVSDRDGRTVIVQRPNAPLMGWALCTLAARLAPEPHLREGLGFVSGAFLFTWTWLELTDGDSPFRRVLGAVVATAIVVRHLLAAA